MNNQGNETGLMCPWCATEIIWDEELGPEPNCPHCENELGGYRTLSLGDNEEPVVQKPAAREEDDIDWSEEDGAGDDTGWAGGGRPRSWLLGRGQN